MVCVFCGGGPLTAEHVLPDWLSEHWDPPGPSTYLSGRAAAVEDSHYTFERVAGTQTVRDACKTCNEGWMARLEGEAKDVLLPMIDGRSVVLTPDDQRLVATWGIKTMMVYQLTHPKDRSTPDDHFRWLRDHLAPPPLSEVWIGRYGDQTRYSYYWHRRLGTTFEAQGLPPIYWVGYALGLSAGDLVYIWYGENVARPDRKRPNPMSIFPSSLIQIWEPQGDVSWPPQDSFSDQDMNSMLDLFQHP